MFQNLDNHSASNQQNAFLGGNYQGGHATTAQKLPSFAAAGTHATSAPVPPLGNKLPNEANYASGASQGHTSYGTIGKPRHHSAANFKLSSINTGNKLADFRIKISKLTDAALKEIFDRLMELDLMRIPDDYYAEEVYFKEADQLPGIFNELEEKNLKSISNVQDTEAAIDAL